MNFKIAIITSEVRKQHQFESLELLFLGGILCKLRFQYLRFLKFEILFLIFFGNTLGAQAGEAQLVICVIGQIF